MQTQENKSVPADPPAKKRQLEDCFLIENDCVKHFLGKLVLEKKG